ncbi:DUF922 domain-containing protein [Mucilaginibacter terrae]|uniref:DUF922 domain-containing protein n=1 Tax=Mucilaginibacter terrae TaxID=1955052 RepID=UPI003638180A
MKLRYVRLICALALCLTASIAATAQPYQQLTPNDFTGQVPQGSGFYVAHTSCNVTMNYDVRRQQQGNYKIVFNIRLQFNPNRSWLNRQMITNTDMMAEVLRHEQGHYQIAYLMQQEMISELNLQRYTGDYQRQANNVFNRIDDKYRRMNTDYDNDTQHMQNRKQQDAWATYLNRELALAGNLAMNE